MKWRSAARATHHSTAQRSTAQHSTRQHNTAQHSTAQHGTARHSTARHGTAQHSTAQHSTAHRITTWTQDSTAQEDKGCYNTVSRMCKQSILHAKLVINANDAAERTYDYWSC